MSVRNAEAAVPPHAPKKPAAPKVVASKPTRARADVIGAGEEAVGEAQKGHRRRALVGDGMNAGSSI